MKKIFTILTAALIGILSFLSGCSCAGNEPLTFKITMPKDNSETLIYNVEYTKDSKDETLDGIFTFEYQNGKYLSTCKRILDRTNIESGIKDLLTDVDIYEVKTEFSIDFTFTINGKENTHTETVFSVAYIAASGMSLAPLYAREDAEYVIIYLNNESAEAAIFKSQSETIYNQDKYTKLKKYKSFNLDEEINFDGAIETEYSGKYTFRTAIDNAELYFALRGVASNIEEKNTTTVPVISPAYNDPDTLKIVNNGNASDKFNIKYNGVEISETVKYANLSFCRNNTKSAGQSQFIAVQTESTENLPNINVPLRITKPLIAYGNFKSMGGLVFTLSEIER